MAQTLVTDYVIWTRHIHGDPAVTLRLAQLRPGETIGLRIEGKLGTWRKMDDGRDGRPTPGLRPLGHAQELWRSLYRSRRGDIVPLEIAQEPEDAPVPGKLVRTEAARKAAMEAILSAKLWPSDPDYVFDRDELHER